MANTKSSKKRAKQSIVRRVKNLNRVSAIKSAIRKVNDAVSAGESVEKTRALLQEVEAQLSRAKSKRIMHPKTAQRKLSRLAKKVNKSAA